MENTTNTATADISRYSEILTKEEMQAEWKRAADLEWGLNEAEFEAQMTRFEKGDIKERAKVYCLFEEINYHSEAAALASGDTAKARKLYYGAFAA